MLDSPSPHCIRTKNRYPISEALSREEKRLKKRCHKTNEINNQAIICWLPRGPSPVYTVRLPKSEADWTALSEQICITASEIRGPSVTSKLIGFLTILMKSNRRRLINTTYTKPFWMIQSQLQKGLHHAWNSAALATPDAMHMNWPIKQMGSRMWLSLIIWKIHYFAFRVVYGLTSYGSLPILSADGRTLISDKAESLNC